MNKLTAARALVKKLEGQQEEEAGEAEKLHEKLRVISRLSNELYDYNWADYVAEHMRLKEIEFSSEEMRWIRACISCTKYTDTEHELLSISIVDKADKLLNCSKM